MENVLRWRAGMVLALLMVAMIMAACGDAEPADTSGCVDDQYSEEAGCIGGVVGHGEGEGHTEEGEAGEDADHEAVETEVQADATEEHAEEAPEIAAATEEATALPTETTAVPTEEVIEVTAISTEVVVEVVEATAVQTEVVEETPVPTEEALVPTEEPIEITPVAAEEVEHAATEEVFPTQEPEDAASVEVRENSLLGTLSRNRGTSTLVDLLMVAGLAETLNTNEPYTIFAPINLVFSDLPAGTVDALRADREQLATILSYHIVPGALRLEDLEDGQTLTALNGEELNVRVDDGRLYINDVMVLISNNTADNGVFHTINQVLLPEGVTLPE